MPVPGPAADPLTTGQSTTDPTATNTTSARLSTPGRSAHDMRAVNASTGTGPGSGPVRPALGPLLPAADIADVAEAFHRAAPSARRWDVESSIAWEVADAGRLTDGQASAVQFITLIEDHLPGYIGVYERAFPLDEDVDLETFIHNRELYHFTIRWGFEEDTHARALFRYQVASGLADPASLRRELAVEGRKPFELPHDHAVSLLAYALVQEKATQIYYQQLRAVVGDPVLADVLGYLARDEARHFAFLADVVERYLRLYGDAVVEPIREVVAQFRMPLADTIRGYWRWALRIADTARYDHTDAYGHLIRIVNHAVDARTDRVDELVRFVDACRSTTAGAPS